MNITLNRAVPISRDISQLEPLHSQLVGEALEVRVTGRKITSSFPLSFNSCLYQALLFLCSRTSSMFLSFRHS